MKLLHKVLIAFLVADIVGVAALLYFIIFNNKNDIEPPTEQKQIYQLEVTETDLPIYAYSPYENWKAETAKMLFNEFCEFYANMENDDYPIANSLEERSNCYVQAEKYGKTGYNRVMAADRACGILTVYGNYLSINELNFVKSKIDEICEKIYSFPLVYFTYTSSGLHIMTINSYYTTNSINNVPLANLLRGIDEEENFLYEFCSETDGWLLDVFVEDLSPDKKNADIEPILLLKTAKAGKYNMFERTKEINTEELNILNKYNRTCITGENVSLENNSWNLFPFYIPTEPEHILVKCRDGLFLLDYKPYLSLENTVIKLIPQTNP